MPHVALGTMRMSGHFNGLMVLDRDAAAAARLVAAARSSGIDLFDTAPVYARGLAESDLGQAEDATTARVWTKVGVDIGGVLPRLDYHEAGMAATLRESCRRLRRTSVDCAFVHNPTPDLLRSLDWKRLYDLMVVDGPADELGASVLTEQEAELLLDAPAPMPVMVEAAVLNRMPEQAARLSDVGHRLIVRSLFSGGAVLKGLSPEDRPRLIEETVDTVVAQYDPWAVVIAPRTPLQLADYRVLVRQEVR